jgi:hypothetical protein
MRGPLPTPRFDSVTPQCEGGPPRGPTSLTVAQHMVRCIDRTLERALCGLTSATDGSQPGSHSSSQRSSSSGCWAIASRTKSCRVGVPPLTCPMLGIGNRFRRVEPRPRAREFVLGLLAGLPRANCWSIAEYARDASPAGMQHLLSRACWDAGVRDDVALVVTVTCRPPPSARDFKPA